MAVVTSAYRRALDAIAAGTFRPGDSAMREELLQIFNRGGFTRGHVMGAQDAALCAMERVGHEGVALGKVLRVKGGFAAVRLERALADGDSLQIRGSQDLDMRYSGHSVEAGGTATLRLRPDMRVCEGDSVARLSDALQLERARAHAPKPISVSMRARFEAGAPMRLFISDGQSVAEASGPSVERAQTRQATPEDARRQLEKLGDTPFLLARPEDLSIDMQDGPVSACFRSQRPAQAGCRATGRGAYLSLCRACRGDAGTPGRSLPVRSRTVRTCRPVPLSALKRSRSFSQTRLWRTV